MPESPQFDFKPTNPDGTPMTQEQIDEEMRKSRERETAALGTQVDPVSGEVRNRDEVIAAQSSGEGGFTQTDVSTAAPGIGGFFGATESYPIYTPNMLKDPNYQGNRALIESARTAAAATPTQSMTGATIATGPQDASRSNALAVRGRQMSLADMLTASASGTGGPSAAEAMLRKGTDASMRGAVSLARSSRVNPAIAMKAALSANADATQQASNDAAILRATEQQQAQQVLNSVLASTRGGDETMRGQDVDLATRQAGFDQDTAKTNMLSSVEQQKMRDELVQKYLALGLSLDQANYQATLQQQQYQAGIINQAIAASKGISVQNAAQGMQSAALVGNAIGSAATAIGTMATSDKRVKKNVDDGEEESRKFLKALKPKGFDYKDPASHGSGRHIGVMAQDVERAAPDLIIDDSDGVKKIDIRKALSASLASLGTIERRLERLEGRRG